MAQLIIFRHGQSEWNLEDKFTGWADVELTKQGIEEAKAAGNKLKKFKLDKGYASALKRTKDSLLIALKVSGQENIPLVFTEALNERNYGDLQGLNKTKTIEKFGEEKVRQWRRSYDISPPNGESLKDTVNRILPYFQNVIVPDLKDNKNIVISTHGNTMRALIMFIEKISPDEIVKLEFETGEMRVYELNNNLEPLKIINLK